MTTKATPLTQIAGVGPALAAILAEHGFDSVESIAASDLKSLSAVPGFGSIKAKATLAAARKVAPSSATPKSKKDNKKDGKGKSKPGKKSKKKKSGKSAKSGSKDEKKKSSKKAKSKSESKKKGGKKKKK